jgi:hypothetical protein
VRRGLSDKLVIEHTPSGGSNIFYRYGNEHTVRDGNLKLAYASHNQQATIETLGAEDTPCDPSVGYTVFAAPWTPVGTITDERDNVIGRLCCPFNQVAPEVNSRSKASVSEPGTEGKPGDDFNARMTRDEPPGDADHPRGWKVAYERR